VDLVPHQLVCALQQLGRQDHDGRRAVADLGVLQLRQLHQDLQRGAGPLSDGGFDRAAPRRWWRAAAPGGVNLQPKRIGAHPGRRVLHLQQLEDGGTVVCDGHIAQLVHQHLRGATGMRDRAARAVGCEPWERRRRAHLVQADGPQRCLDDVGHGGDRHDVLRPDVLPRLPLALDLQPGSHEARHRAPGLERDA
jgi:hypothetical protein